MSNLVSVIVPVYNGERYIKKCLTSIIKQTYSNFEVVVVNDGSTDNTKRVIESLNYDKVNLFNLDNSGVSTARNYGLKKARGDFILFVDADDELASNALEVLVNIQEKSQVDIVRFNGYIETVRGKYDKIEMPVEAGLVLDSQIDREKIVELINSPINSIRCYSPLLFLKNEEIVEFDSNLAYLEDKVFYLENMTRGKKKILFSDELLYYYNYNIESKSKNIKIFKKNIIDLIKTRQKLKEDLEHLKMDSKIVDNSMVVLIIYRIEYFASLTKYKDFSRAIKEILNLKEITLLFEEKEFVFKRPLKMYYYLLKNGFYILFYLISKLKYVIKKN